MHRFSTTRAAKEFLVAEILEQAKLQGTPLSDLERKMLYFSETGWTLPDMSDVAAAFQQAHNGDEYELKIARLVRLARKRTVRTNAGAWSDAIEKLRQEDHYLLMMVNQAGGAGVRDTRWRAVAVLLAISIWCFCRFYYFAFYVIQHYVDPGFRFSGLFAFCRYMVQRQNQGSTDPRDKS